MATSARAVLTTRIVLEALKYWLLPWLRILPVGMAMDAIFSHVLQIATAQEVKRQILEADRLLAESTVWRHYGAGQPAKLIASDTLPIGTTLAPEGTAQKIWLAPTVWLDKVPLTFRLVLPDPPHRFRTLADYQRERQQEFRWPSQSAAALGLGRGSL